ncbi:hypothetical protein ASPCADRAFT_210804 [Aspergillus carbonarius ITEM 5010]|uniref:Uncharacterized protein n=1 Tax=Aspergillus carbonarius (strain ITEM 5010) TaxID=602072 RepID=A0A1R3RBM5_ASPC5|nr:hypothetical protein ASPCADRAFT_210804 [Aspergillus carbonarius ITEM 5010]
MGGLPKALHGGSTRSQATLTWHIDDSINCPYFNGGWNMKAALDNPVALVDSWKHIFVMGFSWPN